MIRPIRMLGGNERRGWWGALVAATVTGFTAPMAHGDNSVYTVQHGDTLVSVAHRYQVPLDTLRDANHLSSNVSLQVGQQLRLPAVLATATAPLATGIYQIKPGDSLSKVAARFGTTPNALASANGLGADAVLQIGQRLTVPAPDAAKAQPAVLASVPPLDAPVRVLQSSVAWQPKAAFGEIRRGHSAEAKVAYVVATGDRVNLRVTPHMEARVVQLAEAGTPLKVVGKATSWWKVEVPGTGQTAFVAGWVVNPLGKAAAQEALAQLKTRPQPTEAQSGGDEDEEPAPEPVKPKPRRRGKPITITESTVNVRTNPSTDAERVATVEVGTKMVVIETRDNWVKVAADNVTGWVAKRLTSLAPPASSGGGVGAAVKSAASDASKLVQTAMTYLGNSYVRGGTTHDGVDCSGLVYAVAKAHGVDVPRTAASQYDDAEEVDRGNLRAGDLVFFKNTYRSGISHVGIYVGNNQFIHAARPGKGVTITDLDDAYYAAHFAGGGRIVD